MLAAAHVAIAVLVAAAAGCVAFIAVLEVATHREHRFARDRAIMAGIALVAVGIASGLVMLVGGDRPGEPLHLVYAALALAVLPVARFWDRLGAHRALAVAVAGVGLVALVIRLAQTG